MSRSFSSKALAKEVVETPGPGTYGLQESIFARASVKALNSGHFGLTSRWSNDKLESDLPPHPGLKYCGSFSSFDRARKSFNRSASCNSFLDARKPKDWEQEEARELNASHYSNARGIRRQSSEGGLLPPKSAGNLTVAVNDDNLSQSSMSRTISRGSLRNLNSALHIHRID